MAIFSVISSASLEIENNLMEYLLFIRLDLYLVYAVREGTLQIAVIGVTVTQAGDKCHITDAVSSSYSCKYRVYETVNPHIQMYSFYSVPVHYVCMWHKTHKHAHTHTQHIWYFTSHSSILQMHFVDFCPFLQISVFINSAIFFILFHTVDGNCL